MQARKLLTLVTWVLLTAAACAHQVPNEINDADDDDDGMAERGGSGTGGTSPANTAGSLPLSGTTAVGTSGSSAGSKGGSTSLPPVGSNGGKAGGSGGKAGSAGKAGAGGAGSGSGGSGNVNMPIPGLSVELKAMDTADQVDWLGGELSVINDTAQPLTVADLKIRYYFTDDLAGAPNPTMALVNWAQCGPMSNLGGATCTGQIVKMPTKRPTADTYVELTCSSNMAELTAGSLLKTSWKAGSNGNSNKQTQRDDHSFMDPTHIVVMDGDTIVWGVEP